MLPTGQSLSERHAFILLILMFATWFFFSSFSSKNYTTCTHFYNDTKISLKS